MLINCYYDTITANNVGGAMKNQKGFTLVEGLLIVLIMAVIGFGGYTVWNNSKDKGTQNNETNQAKLDGSETATESDNESSSQKQPGTFSSYAVNLDTKFDARGTCTSGDVLFAPTYNADNYDYDCGDFDDRFGYASVFFGESTEDVTKLVDTNYGESGEVVELSDGNRVVKHVIAVNEGSKADGGLAGEVEAIYTVYVASKVGGGQFYAVYRTVPSYSDHNSFLGTFENTVMNDWVLK